MRKPLKAAAAGAVARRQADVAVIRLTVDDLGRRGGVGRPPGQNRGVAFGVGAIVVEGRDIGSVVAASLVQSGKYRRVLAMASMASSSPQR